MLSIKNNTNTFWEMIYTVHFLCGHSLLFYYIKSLKPYFFCIYKLKALSVESILNEMQTQSLIIHS